MTTLESQDLFCRSGCGFYGNPEWNWYCSKCWREQNVETVVSPSKRSGPIGKSESFSKFEDKKKRQSIDRNFKHIFKKKELKDISSHPSRVHRDSPSDRSSELSPEAKAVSQEFISFLSTRLPKPGFVDLSRQIKAIIERISKKAEIVPIDEVSIIVQDFYRRLQKKLETHHFFQSLSEEDRITILDYSEKFITTISYKSLFCPPTSDDEEKDLEIQNRIRSLNWISTKDLKCNMSETSQEVRDLLYKAINDILEMDGKIAPQEKMECLVRCCKTIFEMLKVSNTSPASADDFLPCLIYVCLKANPPRIQSNINFITKFCNENKLRMGEGGYFFANLCCALSFISNLDATSVNMDKEEFDSYVSGRALPPGSWQSSLLMCEGLQVMSQNLKTLSDLTTRHDRVQEDAQKLQLEMTNFQRLISEEVEAVLIRTEYTIRSKDHHPLSDDSSPGRLGLPEPLLPSTSEALPLSSLEDFLGDASFNENSSFEECSSHHESSIVPSQASRESSYVGFSAQSFNIPSIPCDNAVSSSIEEEDEPSSNNSASTATTTEERPSSSSGASSTDESSSSASNNNAQNGGAQSDNQDKLVKAFSGLFNTFDNLI